nr:MAG TPA: nucelotide kinase [Caudoviricetes sp.]
MKDMVNHPSHYTQYTQEVIDTITEWVKDYNSVEGYYIGTVLKYLARAPYKGKKLEDLKKASFYLQEAIEYIEKQESRKSAKNGQDFLYDFIKVISGLGSQPIKMTANVNNTDKLMESIKNGTYGENIKGDKLMRDIKNGTVGNGHKDPLMESIKNGTYDNYNKARGK